jgi:hypothetical protein
LIQKIAYLNDTMRHARVESGDICGDSRTKINTIGYYCPWTFDVAGRLYWAPKTKLTLLGRVAINKKINSLRVEEICENFV